MRFSKWLVVLCVLLALAFTGIVLYLMANGMEEPGVLIGSFFGFITGELWALATIRKKKVEYMEPTTADDEIEGGGDMP